MHFGIKEIEATDLPQLEGIRLVDVRSEQELLDWEKRIRRHLHLRDDSAIEYVCEPKIDGLAISLTYENGRFTRGVTRGDGQRGGELGVRHDTDTARETGPDRCQP